MLNNLLFKLLKYHAILFPTYQQAQFFNSLKISCFIFFINIVEKCKVKNFITEKPFVLV